MHTTRRSSPPCTIFVEIIPHSLASCAPVPKGYFLYHPISLLSELFFLHFHAASLLGQPYLYLYTNVYLYPCPKMFPSYVSSSRSPHRTNLPTPWGIKQPKYLSISAPSYITCMNTWILAEPTSRRTNLLVQSGIPVFPYAKTCSKWVFRSGLLKWDVGNHINILWMPCYTSSSQGSQKNPLYTLPKAKVTV